MTEAEMAPVARAARDAVADYYVQRGYTFLPDAIRSGAFDEDDMIQAFARAMLAAEAAAIEREWQPIDQAWKYGDTKLIVTDGQSVHGAAWWHSREQAWLDCDGIVPTKFMTLPLPPSLKEGAAT